jgi:L-lactate dehydrogenase complex protein LldE
VTKVGLFIPCYIDQLYPGVGLATLQVLEKFNIDVEYPMDQTCCGQPMVNAGCAEDAAPLAEKFYTIFKNYSYVVCPSGSCTAMVRYHYEEYLRGQAGFAELKKKTFELCEFLTDVLKVEKIEGWFPYKVGLHQSCHGLRELRLASSSERMGHPFNKIRPLLASLDGITLVELNRPDECCGFGGTFAVGEEAVSCMMGKDRIIDHEKSGTEVLTGVDMSCLMHLEGLIRREGKPIRVMHIAEILAEN